MSVIWKTYEYNQDGLDLLELFKSEPYLFFLDSSLQDESRGRYSFLGFDPFDLVKTSDKDALEQVQRKYVQCRHTPLKTYSPLHSGIVGYVSYDHGFLLESKQSQNQKDLDVPDCLFGFYDCVITIDHHLKKLYVSSTGLFEKDVSKRKDLAQKKCLDISKRLERYFEEKNQFSSEESKKVSFDKGSDLPFKSNMTKKDYCSLVEKALDYIAQGDIYQVNLSQRFSLDVSGYSVMPTEIYSVLREVSPSHFGGFFDCGGFQIISSSPERFVSIKNNLVQMRPMKGTRPRGKDAIEDCKLRRELINSEKEKAELLMITDLHRNDLGRVCDYGSIRVREMRTIEEYETVYQATSTIEGVLSDKYDGIDLLKLCFPGGSITGCPKIRAMEVIDELESVPRFVYTGALGYISFSGEMDFSILIRSMLKYKDSIHFHVGGGIVADSIPMKEYEETLVKAEGIKKCLQRVYNKKEVYLAFDEKNKDLS